MSKIRIEGDKALSKVLNGLSGKLFKQVIMRANAEAMKPVSQAMKQAARGLDIPIEQAKGLAKAIGRRTKVYAKDGNVVTIVGPRVFSEYDSQNDTRLKVPYLKIEFGGVRDDGVQIQSHPFIRPVWDSLNRKVEANYGASVAIGLKKIAEREAKKSARKSAKR